jgi:hypothetical protein
MTMLYFSLAVSTIFLTIVNAIAFSRKGTGAGRATLCSVLAAFPLIFTLTLILPLNALAVAFTGMFCWMEKARPRWFLVSSISATVVVYAVVILPKLWEWDRLKKDFPMESLASRLAYEDHTRIPTPFQGEAFSTAGSHLDSLETRLLMEARFESYGRTLTLEHLHAGIVQQFIDSPGVGVGRIILPKPRFLEQQGPEEPIPQPIPYSQPLDLAPTPLREGSDLLNVHLENMVDFLNPFGFGYIRDRDHVAGFRPHQFQKGLRSPQRWRINRLELVGLLKYEEPVVYLSANLPRMDELSQAATRSLDTFEKESLGRLLRGDDLMIQETPQQMRMFGSIRAGQTCLRCHSVQRGELLGAFSYRMLAKELP